MNTNKEDSANMSRRKFLKVGGSLAVGGLFTAFAGVGVWNLVKHPDRLFYDSKVKHDDPMFAEDEALVSPYRRIFAFEMDEAVLAFDLYDGCLYLATSGGVVVCGMSGEVQNRFTTEAEVRDVAVFADKVYVLFSNRIEVYDREGGKVQSWAACSDNSDYCQLTVFEGGIFVTDAANKNICQYGLEGQLVRFIESPNGFVVPSYCFAITHMDGLVYCSNPGRHLVECYTVDGEYTGSFGKAGNGEGAFSGCCNPSFLTPAHNGELLTSEKGRPRISCYSHDGHFRSVLLDSKALGGGHDAYKVRINGDKLIVVGGKKVSIFQYSRNQSQDTACGRCTKECPLKSNL